MTQARKNKLGFMVRVGKRCRRFLPCSWEDKSQPDYPVLHGRQFLRVTYYRRCRREDCRNHVWQVMDVYARDVGPADKNTQTHLTVVK